MGWNGRRRRGVEPTEEREQIEPLYGWPEQRDYELIRPLVLFANPAANRRRPSGGKPGVARDGRRPAPLARSGDIGGAPGDGPASG
jgi:hypothetical protein